MPGTPLQAALPRETYVDEAAWRRERDQVLFGEWFCVGRRDDLGLDVPNRLAVVEVVGESVLVTCDADGALHAAYNVCRHRGSQLHPVEPGSAPVGCAASSLRCPYHSWTYALSGELLRAPHTDGVDPAEFALHRVGAAAWQGFVFVHLGPEREPDDVTTALAGPAERLQRYGMRDLVTGVRDALRGGGELQGAAGELQRVLPLRPRAPRAVPARPGVRGRRPRPGLGRRRPAPRGRLDVHHDRDHHARAAAGARRGRAHPPQGRAGLPQPDAVGLGRPRRRVRAAAAGRRTDRRRVSAALRTQRGRRGGLRPLRRP